MAENFDRIPNGITRVNPSTTANVGKVFTEFNTYLSSTNSELKNFDASIDKATDSISKFKREYERQNKNAQSEWNDNLDDLNDSLTEQIKGFRTFLQTARENNATNENIHMSMVDMRGLMDATLSSQNESLARMIRIQEEGGKGDDVKDLVVKFMESNQKPRNDSKFPAKAKGDNSKDLMSMLMGNDRDSKDTPEMKEIRQKIKEETAKNQTEYLDTKFLEVDKLITINNDYYKELAKLKNDALSLHGENFEMFEDYKKAIINLEDEFNVKRIKENISKEAEGGKVKVLDNKFAKGQNLGKKINEYQDELAKLKTTALDTYGEDYENNEEYKKALANLNDTYLDEMKQARKDDFRENHEMLAQISDGIKKTFDRNEKTFQGMLGPMNLFIAPLQDFFGGLTPIFKFFGGGIKKLFRSKKNPTANDVVKSGSFGIGSLFLGNKLEQLFGKKKGGGLGLEGGLGSLFGKDGLLGSLLGKGGGGGLASVGKMLTGPAGGIAMIAAGIIWAAIDGIKGALKSDEWGVSKVSGFLGGFFAGTGEGIKNAFANAGKWALVGAGVGMLVAPPVGAIVGGLAGAAIGGLLGFIGGEKLAKGFDAIGAWFKEKILVPIKEFFFSIFDVEKFKNIWKGEGSVMTKIGKTIGQGLITLVKLPFKALIEGGKLTGKLLKNIWEAISGLWSKLWGKLKEWLPKLWQGTKDFFGGLFNGLKDAIVEHWTKVKETVSNIWNGFKEKASDIWNKNKEFISNAWEGAKQVASKVWNGFKEKASDIWNKNKEFVSNAWEGAKQVASKVWGGFKEKASDIWNKNKEFVSNAWEGAKMVTDKAWKGIKKTASKTWEKTKKGLSKTWGAIKDGTSKAWDTIKDGTSKAWDGVKDKVNKGFENVKNSISDIKEDFAEGGIKGVVDGLFEKLKTKINEFFTKNPLGIWLDSHIITPIKNFFSSIGNFFSYMQVMWSEHGGIMSIDDIVKGFKDKDASGKSGFDKYVEQKDKVVASSLNVEEYFNKYKSDYNIKTKKGKVISKGDEKDIVNAVVLKLSENPSLKYNDALKEVLADKKFTSTFLKVNDAIIRPNGDVIKTDPKDTLVALKDIPFSLKQEKIKADNEIQNTVKRESSSEKNGSKDIERKLNLIADILNKILAKDIQVNLPQQTRFDMDVLMSGGAV